MLINRQNERYFYLYMFLIIISIFIISCSDSSISGTNNKIYEFEINIAKWYNNADAAVSITVDEPFGLLTRAGYIKDMVVDKGLRMDYEFITSVYEKPEYKDLVRQIRDELPEQGIHIFGHGHQHIKHVDLSFEDAYADFKKCFDLMTEWGLNPKTYAYPGGKGYNPSTQLANKLAGFISARNTTTNQNIIYNCKYDEAQPSNWYDLPSVIAGAGHPDKIENHYEMEPILNNTIEYKAWLIICYHSIGMEGGYAYYPKDDFIKDLEQIKNNNFWSGNYDDVTCYVKEKNNFYYETKSIVLDNNEICYEVKFLDNLDNHIYNFPLTLNIDIMDGKNLKKMIIEPAIDSTDTYQIKNGKVTINVVPNEKTYLLKFRN